jgi:cell division protein FtsA
MGDLKLDKNKAALNIRLYSIVNDRVKELLNIIKEKIEAYGFIHSIPCGVVITGGAANLKGLSALANTIFNMPVRIGTAIDVEGPSEAVGNPIYSTAIGILKYANQIRNFMDLGQFDDRRQRNKGFLTRFRDFISRILRNE